MSDSFGGRGPVNNNLWTIETVKVDGWFPYWTAKVVGTPDDVGTPAMRLESQPEFRSIFKDRAIDQAKDWIDELVGAGKYAPAEKSEPEVTQYDPHADNWARPEDLPRMLR